MSLTGRFALASISTCVAFGLHHATAANFSWDPGLTPATPSGGAGTWNTSNINWSNGATDVIWPNVAANDDKALFGGTAGTVTLGSTLTAGGLQFNTSGYAISGAAIDLTLNSNALGSDALLVSPGVSGITIGVRKLILTNGGAGNIGDLINTDQIDFGSTIVAYSGSRQFTLTNSAATATTTITNLAGSSGTGTAGTSLYLNQGNLTITNFASGSSASALAAASSTATNAGFAFRYNGTDATKVGTITLTGNNTLLNNAGTGTYGINFLNANAIYDIQHDNALGARDASNVLTDTFVEFNGGTLVSSTGARTLENAISQTGNFTIGGANAIVLSGAYTNSGGNRILTVNNSALTTLSGAVNLANDNATARLFTVTGTGNTTISGNIANNAVGNTLASALTKNGAGTLTLSGSNSYTGATTVTGGTLVGALNGALGAGNVSVLAAATSLTIQTGVTNAISDTASLSLAGGGTADVADLGYLRLDGNETVGSLTLAGVPFGAGVYGASTAPGVLNVGLTNPDEFFSGSGLLTVVPEPGSLGMMLLAGAGLLGSVRRVRRVIS